MPHVRTRRARLVPWLLFSLLATPALADRTKLMEVNLESGTRRRIDARPTTSTDRELDAMLGQTMGKTFSTSDLERIDEALRRQLKIVRPRAMARLLIYLYPGRISRSALSELREVLVDLELVVDPCGRSVCEEAVGKHLDLIARSLKQTVIRTRRYTIRFQSVTVRTAADPGSGYEVYRFGAQQVVGLRDGGGAGLVRQVAQQRAGYDRQMLKQVVHQLRLRRLQPASAPRISRSPQSVTAQVELNSDRVRYRTQAIEALLATAKALVSHPQTPPAGELTVVAHAQQRGPSRHRFHCSLQSLRLYLAGRLTRQELLGSYLREDRPGGQRLAFDDEEARGGALAEDDDGPDRTSEILAAHFGQLAPCLQAEARRDRRFRGATLQLSVSPAGTAGHVRLERGGRPALQRCLARTLAGIRFPRHGGAARDVRYPMIIQR